MDRLSMIGLIMMKTRYYTLGTAERRVVIAVSHTEEDEVI